MSLRVLLNVQSLAPPLTGIGRYTLEILRALSFSSSIERLQCFAEWGWMSPEKALQNAGEPVVDVVASKPPVSTRFRNIIRSLPGAYPLRCRMRDLAFTWRARPLGRTVYHEPNYVLRPFSGPRVLTAHDVSHLRYPEFHPAERVRLLEKRLPGSLDQADQVITVSEFSKKELVRFLGVPPEKITAIPLGVDPACRPRSSSETDPLLKVLGLEHGGYLLVVATMEPRKNLPRLVKAFADLPDPLREAFPLVIAGAPGWGPRFDAPGLAALEAKGQIRRLGYVSEPALPLLYAGAGAFAFPSLYEGFGLPPLEALASGVPVLTSFAASLPEVVGNAALLVNPEDTSDITCGLRRLLTDVDFRARAGEDGPRQAAAFTWEECAGKTIEVYFRAIGQ
jgi:glycosyltransferase involved in cell wall biosynthesis